MNTKNTRYIRYTKYTLLLSSIYEEETQILQNVYFIKKRSWNESQNKCFRYEFG